MHAREEHPPQAPGRADRSIHPASYAQEQLYFLDELASGNAVYNILMVWRLTGPLRVDALRGALDLVVSRHEALRTTIRRTDDGIRQEVAPHRPLTLLTTDLSGLPEADRDKRLTAEIEALNAQPYDLGTGPLHRFGLFRLGPHEHVLCQGFHHIVTDGWSTGLINAEISTAYRDLCAGVTPSLGEISLHYSDYAVAQRERLDGAGLKEDLDFWRAKLDGVTVLDLPADRPRTAGGGRHGKTLNRRLSDDVRAYVTRLGQDGASSFMVLAAALNVVLSRCTGRDDIPVGVPMLGRPHPRLESVVGMFVNMAVLRCDLSGDPTFRDVVDRVMEGTFELYDHQEAPFNQVVGAVRPDREPGRNPLFQISLQVLGGKTSGENLSLEGVTAELLPQAAEGSRFDLAITLVDDGSAFHASVEYSTDLFDSWRPEALLTHLEAVLRAAADDPDRPVSRIPLVEGDERQLLLDVGHGVEGEGGNEDVPASVARIARTRPAATAVVCGERELTYAELDHRAEALALRLRATGLGPGTNVVVVSDRWDHVAVAALGVWRCDGALTHLSVEEAVERLAFVAVDTGAPVVLSDDGAQARLPHSSAWVLLPIDSAEPDVPVTAAGPRPGQPSPVDTGAHERSPAQIVHIPDATGGSRGVRLPHSALSFTARSHRRVLGLGDGDRLFLPPIAAEARHGALWAALTCGAAVVAAAPEEAADAGRLSTLLSERRVTHAHLPPALRALLDPTSLPDLTCVRGSDRELSTPAAQAWTGEGRRFVTVRELPGAAVVCARSGHGDIVPYENRSLYVVDDALNLVPRGVEGRLLVGGAPGSLADGLLRRPEAGSPYFVPDPFRPGRMAFLSEERARWTHGLRLELLGAEQERIELGGVSVPAAHVEALLCAHPDVAAAVVARDGAAGVSAYVRPAGDRAVDPADLGSHLGGHLPEGLIPGRWVVVPSLPVRADWEVDRAAVTDVVAPDEAGGTAGAEPLTPTEESVAEVFREVLDVSELEAEESFFSAGGNSLQAMRAISRVNTAFGIKLSVRVMYGNVTVRAIAALVEEKLGEVRP
ncbi:MULTISPECIES: condensation domain-containing protein [unclassified Streptomyces]|uniref:condensation domain-containing protein n=1 Tax=unclassified Streptomyces TaxID=2593676 RepID=UPI00344DDE44